MQPCLKVKAPMQRATLNVAPLEFDPVIKCLHWLTLFLVVTVFALAFSIDRVPHNEKEFALQILLIQPLLGLIHTGVRGDRVNRFFLGDLPALTGIDRPLAGQAHERVGQALLVLIGLHAAAGLYHHFWRRDNTRIAMPPHGIQVASRPELQARRMCNMPWRAHHQG